LRILHFGDYIREKKEDSGAIRGKKKRIAKGLRYFEGRGKKGKGAGHQRLVMKEKGAFHAVHIEKERMFFCSVEPLRIEGEGKKKRFPGRRKPSTSGVQGQIERQKKRREHDV